MGNSPFVFQSECVELKDKKKYCAGISSFGFQGTISHIIVESNNRTHPLCDFRFQNQEICKGNFNNTKNTSTENKIESSFVANIDALPIERTYFCSYLFTQCCEYCSFGY